MQALDHSTGAEASEHIAPLDAGLVLENARLLATAFFDDPAFGYLFPDAATRSASLEDFFVRNQRIHLPYRCIHAARGEGGELRGTVTLRPRAGLHISLWTMARRGLLPFALRNGASAVKRLLWLKDVSEQLEADAAQGVPHFYVHMMAVPPALQGHGVGTRLVTRVLEQALKAHPGTRTVLSTHRPQNVVFYRRIGFEVTGERLLEPPGGTPYRAWMMAR
jgi:GNAT superfamily N-acetyltransferase